MAMSRCLITPWHKYDEPRANLPWRVSKVVCGQRGTALHRQHTWITLQGGGTLGCNYCNVEVVAIAQEGRNIISNNLCYNKRRFSILTQNCPIFALHYACRHMLSENTLDKLKILSNCYPRRRRSISCLFLPCPQKIYNNYCHCGASQKRSLNRRHITFSSS